MLDVIAKVINNLPSFLETVLSLLTTLLIFLTVIRTIIKGSNQEQVERLLTILVEQAEDDFSNESKAGEKKYLQTVQNLYKSLPLIVQLTYSLKEVNNMVTSIVNEKFGNKTT